MLPSQSMALTLLAAAGAVLLGGAPEPLRVMRVTPDADAAPSSIVTVTFDRPVAGSLDRTVDPARVFRIEPGPEGTLDWRDPVTLRFRPAEPLPANRAFRVTVSDGFGAMDGSRLERPFTFEFRVRGPRVLAGSPVSAGVDGWIGAAGLELAEEDLDEIAAAIRRTSAGTGPGRPDRAP